MNAFDILAIGITMIASFVVGYLAGSGKKPEEVVHEIREQTKTFKKRRTPVGTVTRPSAEKVLQWQDKEKESQDEAFKESFIKQTGLHP